eukprot:7390793-Prymnesium_polylepis.1
MHTCSSRTRTDATRHGKYTACGDPQPLTRPARPAANSAVPSGPGGRAAKTRLNQRGSFAANFCQLAPLPLIARMRRFHVPAPAPQ